MVGSWLPVARRVRADAARRVSASVAAVAAVGALLVVPWTVFAVPATAVNPPLLCDQSTIYAINSGGALDSISVATGAVTAIATFPHATNAVGVSVGGGVAYAYSGGTGNNYLDVYNPSTGVTSSVGTLDSASTSAIRGAVDPANGYFYYAASTATSSSTTTTYLGAYDPATGTKYSQVGRVSVPASGNGGDLAFSKTGTMFFLTGNYVYRVDSAVPATSGTTTLATSLVATLTGVTSSPGLAFASNGYLYVSSGTTLYKVNPATGVVTSTIAIGSGYTPSDLASCNYPDSLTGSVSVADRVNTTDEFTVTLAGGTTWSASSKTATTTGTATGVQAASAGPVLAVGGGVYTATQTMASGTAADYNTVWTCTSDDGTVLATGSAATAATTATYTDPASTSANGDDVTCLFTNTPKTATIELSKVLSVNRSSGSDQFTVEIHRLAANGLTEATSSTAGAGAVVTAGSGDTGTTTVVADRSYYLTESMAAGSTSTLSQYGAAIACSDANNVQTSGLPSGAFSASTSFTPVAGAAISCTITNSAIAPTLILTAALGSPRLANTDQFTVAVHVGTPGGPVLNSAAASTTTGTGSTVTPGSGTTGTVTGAAGSTYALTNTASANGAYYAATITCTDANGYQTGLPTGAAFTSTTTITPVAGAAISCTLTNALTSAALALTKTNPASLTVGTPATYTLTVANTGGTATTSATVADQLAANVAYTGVTGAGWSCLASGTIAAGQLVTCTGPAIAGGATSTFRIQVTPAVGALGTSVANKAAVDPSGGTSPVSPTTCTGPDAPSAGCAVTPGLTVAGVIDLQLGITNPPALTVGVPSDYTLTVTNTGFGASPTATVIDALPVGLLFNSATGAVCTAAGQVLTCTLTGPIAPAGASQSFTVNVTPQTSAAGRLLVDRAAVDPTGAGLPVDPTTCTANGSPAGCAVTAALTVGTARLQLVKTATPVGAARSPVRVGDQLSFLYTVTNASATSMINLRIGDPDAASISCPVTTLSGGASAVCHSSLYTVTQADVDAGTVTSSGVATAELAGCTGASTCPVIKSPAAAASTPTRSVPSVSVTTSGALDDANANGVADVGEKIVYTVRVTNTGTVDLVGVVVTDNLTTLTCPSTTLAVGASMNCTGTYIVQVTDVAAGVIHNIASAHAGSQLGQTVTAPDTAATRVSLATADVSPLAQTGFPGTDMAAKAVLLLLAGFALLTLGRRRRTCP